MTRDCQRHGLQVAMLAGLLLTALAGCYTQERVVKDPWAQIRDLGGKTTGGGSSPRPDDEQLAESAFTRPNQRVQWTIALTSFTGDDQDRQARRLINRLRRESNVPDLWLRSEQGQTYVYRGRYIHPDLAQAREDLRQTRMIEVDGARPYRDADMREISIAPLAASASELDLRRYSGQGLYSLQVAAFDDKFTGKGDYRNAAEEMARQLRKEGDLAFVYHGPHMSMVTVGLWDYKTAWIHRVGVQDTYSEVVRRMQKKHPFNRYNNQQIVEVAQGQELGKQQSFLVRVP